MKDPLGKCTIAATGDFGKARSQEKIKQWVEANGGTFVTAIRPGVTHLVCSADHYKKSAPMIRQASKVKGIKVVSYDWLEDSLLSKSPKREGPYLMDRQAKSVAKSRAKKKATRKRNLREGVKAFKKGCKDFQRIMDNDGYHVYRDSTGFSYDLALARADLTTNQNERYSLKVGSLFPTPIFPTYSPCKFRVPPSRSRTQRLQLYESHTAPFIYACYVVYSSASSGGASEILAPLNSSFEVAMSTFTKFFKLKTKKDWDERLVVCKDVVNERAFLYIPPAAGEPLGKLPDVSPPG